MGVNEANIVQVLEALTTHAWVIRSGVRFLSSTEARFQLVSADTLTWCWGDRRPAERALEGGVGYHDLDGKIVSIVLTAEDNEVTEIELWRGDDLPILSLPQRSDLWEVVPGETYSSRA